MRSCLISYSDLRFSHKNKKISKIDSSEGVLDIKNIKKLADYKNILKKELNTNQLQELLSSLKEKYIKFNQKNTYKRNTYLKYSSINENIIDDLQFKKEEISRLKLFKTKDLEYIKRQENEIKIMKKKLIDIIQNNKIYKTGEYTEVERLSVKLIELNKKIHENYKIQSDIKLNNKYEVSSLFNYFNNFYNGDINYIDNGVIFKEILNYINKLLEIKLLEHDYLISKNIILNTKNFLKRDIEIKYLKNDIFNIKDTIKKEVLIVNDFKKNIKEISSEKKIYNFETKKTDTKIIKIDWGKEKTEKKIINPKFNKILSHKSKNNLINKIIYPKNLIKSHGESNLKIISNYLI